VNKAGRLAPWILKWGPDLIPQPGSLIRCSAWEAVGGLDESYGLAFDLDLLLRLQKLGPLIDVRRIVSSFRWHSQSLTVDDRHRNISESERAKRNALTPVGRKIAWAWEPPVRWATHLAAREVQRRARRLAGATTAR
jgi:GT2 family glycosyltransferase